MGTFWYGTYAVGVVVYNVAVMTATTLCSLFVTPEPPPAHAPLVFRDPGRYGLATTDMTGSDPLLRYSTLRLLNDIKASQQEAPPLDF